MLTLVCFDNITEFITLDSVNGKCRRWKRVDLPPFSPLPTPVILNSTASGKTKGHIEYCLLAEDHSMVAWPSPSTDRYKLQTSFFSTEIPAALEPPPTAGTGTNGSLQILPFFPFPRHPRSGRRRQREIYGRQAQEKDCRCCCCSPRPRQWQPPCTESVGGGRERGEYGTLYMCASLGQSHPTQVMDVSKRARPGRGGAAGAGKRWHCITWPTGPGFVFFPEGRGGGGGVVCLRASPSLASLLLLVFVRRPLAGLPSSFRHDDDGFRRTTAWALVHHHKQRDKQVRYVVGALGAHRMSGHAPSSLLSGRYMDGR